jgi:hypothetical protein
MSSKDTPEDVRYPELYRQAQQEARQRFRVYPSAYANGWMVQRYQKLSQERHGNNGYTARNKDLGEWFAENWVDISRPKPGGGFEPCGRATEGMSETDYRRRYPKCLPAARAARLSDAERRRLIERKRREGLPEGGRPQQTSSDVTKERYTYNGVSVTATRRRSSSRTDKKYERTVTVGDRTRLVHYGDPNLEMRRDDPERRRNFLARHNCSDKRDPFAPGFWACLDWQRTDEKEMTMPDTVTMDPRTHDAVLEKGYDYMDKGDGYDYRKDDMMEYAKGDGYDEGMKYAYYGVTSFAEMEDLQASKMATERVQELGEMFQGLAANIMRDAEVMDKAGALRTLVDEFQTRLDTLNGGMTTKEQEPVETLPAEPANSLTVWKEATGQYRWLAVYSNKFRDQDSPPEIISEKSHMTFTQLVDDGVVPYPELWHWHIPGTRWGVADWLAYADGFALASGTVDRGHEKEAETLAASPIPIRVSHGMPERFIVRNPGDPSVIDFHITTEISDLPSPAAANPLTGFQVFKGASDMALPAQKKQYLKQAGLSDDRIAEIENGLTSRAKEAHDAGLEYKETAAPVAETPKEEPAVVKEETAPAVEPAMTRQEVADAMSQIVSVFTEQMQALTESMTALATEVKELRRTDADRIAEKAADTPPASLQALIAQRIVGNEAARVDGRSTLAKDKPAAPAAAGPTPYSFINSLVEHSRQVAE